MAYYSIWNKSRDQGPVCIQSFRSKLCKVSPQGIPYLIVSSLKEICTESIHFLPLLVKLGS